MPAISHLLTHFVPRSSDDHPIFHPPLSRSSFTLDSSGVAGFFGGDSAVSGMATVNLYQYRRWGGWYNTPGSYEIAKQYGQLAKSRLWEGVFPGGGTHDPAQLFRLDGKVGPQFIATRSGSSFSRTGHLAHLIARKAREIEVDRTREVKTRRTTPKSVTIIDLPHEPKEIVHPTLLRSHTGLLAIIPIAVSIGACVLCALVVDWWCFASIALGIVANGSACFVIGSGKLTFKHHVPAKGVPPGDGILWDDDGVVVLRGPEGAVNSLTRGRFLLQYGAESVTYEPRGKPDDVESGGKPRREKAEPTEERAEPAEGNGQLYDDEVKESFEERRTGEPDDNEPPESDKETSDVKPKQSLIGPCSALLTGQFLLQLLLIPQSTLFGQILFVATLAVSWAYNSYLSSLDREDIQTDILLDILDLKEADLRKFKLGSWTAMVVFACLSLQSDQPMPNPMKLLDGMIPNDTVVWQKWKAAVARKLSANAGLVFTAADSDLEGLDEEERRLLRRLFEDAKEAFKGWKRAQEVFKDTLDSRPTVSPAK